MDSKKIIPDIPEYEKTTEEVEKRLHAYINYIVGLSPRIKIIRPIIDETFDLEEFQNKVKSSFEHGDSDRIHIVGWPERKDVAFIVAINSSVESEKNVYLVEDTHVFCYGNFSFGCQRNDFDQVEIGDDYTIEYSFSPSNFSSSEDSNTWKDSIRRIKHELDFIQERVPLLPESEPPV